MQNQCFIQSLESHNLLIEIGNLHNSCRVAFKRQESNSRRFESNRNTPQKTNIINYNYIKKVHSVKISQFPGSCFKGANCKKVHLKQLEGGWTRDTDSIAAIEIASKMELPAIGTTVKVIPVFIADSHIIYCHFDNQDQHPNIKYLEVHLNNPEEQKLLVQYKFPISIPSLHELVLAKFTDGKWYRARIIDSYPEEDSYRVFFVDYGNSWTVQLGNLRKWSAKFSYLPFQAVCVHLYGVKPNPAKRVEAMDYLDVMVFDKTYKGLVKNNTNELTLDLFDLKGNSFIDDYLAAGLVQKKPMFEGEFDKMTNIPA